MKAELPHEHPMIPYVNRLISPADIALFWRITKHLESLPDFDFGEDYNGDPIELSCHMLARSVARAFNLKYEDGKFLNQYDHSWIKTEWGNIIDVYPVGILRGPLLVEGEATRLASRLYFPMEKERAQNYYSKMLQSTWFERSTDKVSIYLMQSLRAS